MIAIIPARGGSKGLPGKNIKALGNKPLITHTIEAALRAQKVTRIIVSTDDQEIADIALEYGAEVPFLRPKELAADDSLAVDNYIYTLDRLEKEGNIEIKSFIVLQPTSPLRGSDDIDNAIEVFNTKEADSVISYCKELHPMSWHKKVSNEGLILPIFDDRIGNRQDEEPTYFPNGSIFIFRSDLIKNRSYYSERSFAYIMDRESSVDIDTIEDFDYAEYLLNKKQKR